MGGTLFQGMTRKESEILPANTNLKQIEPSNSSATTPLMADLPAPRNEIFKSIMLKPDAKTTQKSENAMTGNIVPFEPNFEGDSTLDMDLVQLLTDLENNSNQQVSLPSTQGNPMPTTNQISATTNTVQTTRRSMFENCKIGQINFNIVRK